MGWEVFSCQLHMDVIKYQQNDAIKTKGVFCMAWFGWVVVALVFVLSFFVGKGLSLKKAALAPKAKPVAVDPQLAAEHLAGALRC